LDLGKGIGAIMSHKMDWMGLLVVTGRGSGTKLPANYNRRKINQGVKYKNLPLG